MTHRNLHIETCQSGHEGGRSVTVNQYNIWLFRFQHSLDALQNIDRHIEQRLLVLHNRKVIVRNYMKCLQHLIQHLTMLAGHANDRLQFLTLFELIDQRTHLDCFRAGSKNEHYLTHGNSSFLLTFPIYITKYFTRT